MVKLLALISCVLCMQCSKYPTETSGKNLYEMESVWQYLKTYCIWQDTLWSDTMPFDAFKYNTPEALLASVHDTLHGENNNYTSYDFSRKSSHKQRLNRFFAANTIGSVSWDSLSDSIGYLQIQSFEPNQLYGDFLSAIADMEKFPDIIIDLQRNGGGNLAPTDSIIQSILPDNTPYIIEKYRKYDRATSQASTVDWDTIRTGHGRQLSRLSNKRFVILIDGGTASASEVLIAALKDGLASTRPVTLIGETTYGKGMGQILIIRDSTRLPDIKITFLRMKGLTSRVGNYHRKGIAPDIHISSMQNPRTYDSLVVLTAMRVFQKEAVLPQAVLQKTSIASFKNNNPLSEVSETSIIEMPGDRVVK